MDAEIYKKYREEYMWTDNNGTTAIHTFMCIFFTVQCTLLVTLQPIHNEKLRYLLEYLIVVTTLINAHTIYPTYIYILNLALIILLAIKFAFSSRKLYISRIFNLPNVFVTSKMKSITIIRGLTYLITVYSICAVDFHAFMKELAKTEKYGFSFMDTGVGLFVLISGVVHKDPKNHKYTTILKSNMKNVSALTVLGLARYFSVKQLDYHEQVTEYGVHWNFFFTLALCKFITTLLLIFFEKPFVLSIVIAFVHQTALDLGLEKWVFSDADRSGFLSANREGITATLGYVSLYLFAVYVKSILKDNRMRRKNVVAKFVIIAFLLWLSTYILQTQFRRISRVLANMTYITYLSSIFVTILTILYIFEAIQNEKANIVFEVPPIIDGINENGLIFFIIGNLLTGSINLSIFTLLVPDLFALVILHVYMITTIAITLIFNKCGFKI